MAKKHETKKQNDTKSSKAAPTPKPKAPSPRPQAKKSADAKKPVAPPTAAQETAPAAPAPANAEAPAPTVSAPSAPTAPRVPDPRLPAPGTLLQKRDRHGAVRCECTVEEGGIRYAGALYRSLSAAAMAAAKDLGLNNKTQNGFTFWGLSKPPRPARDPLAALERAWERYHGNVLALVKDGVTDDDENKNRVLATIRKHAEAMESLHEKVA